MGNKRSLNVEFPVRAKTGEIRYWSFSASSPGTLDDGRRFIIGMAVDVTERREAKQALMSLNQELEKRVEQRTSELDFERKRFYDMLENLPVMVCLLTPEHKVVFANRLFREKFGEPKERHCYEFVACENQPCESCESFLPLKTGKPHHWMAKFPDGTVCDAFDFPFTDTDGSRLILEADVDITKRIDLEKQLKEKEVLAAIGATAGMVGHDIRNPLQSIVGDIYLLKQDLASLPDLPIKRDFTESLEGIEQNVSYINKIVQDLQDFAKPISARVGDVNFEELFKQVLVKEAIPKNIEVVCTIEEDAREIKSDNAMLKRILVNLVNNAVQAMPEGGKLEIQCHQENGEVVVSVQDSGVGIPKDVKDKIFTPLFTTKSKGQGFGLPVVKRLTEALGGTVSFESEVGKGTKFKITLPS